MNQTMNQQQPSMHHRPLLPERDLFYTILADQKRTSREYCTATLESNCQVVRQMFTELMNDTVLLQGQLYYSMQQANMYDASSKALRQDVDKRLQTFSQKQQKTQQFVQQHLM